ncbi:MAG TPA: hypothetical protein VN641_02990 [Urbifossiella sp.]|nr:hypothetical protein [Urbifossiella sp.]
MIDDPYEASELLRELDECLPTQAIATPQLVMALRGNTAGIQVNDVLAIDTVAYLGDDGGVACGIRSSGADNVLVISITHLRFDAAHPLAGKIGAYQARRVKRLRGFTSRMSKSKRKAISKVRR